MSPLVVAFARALAPGTAALAIAVAADLILGDPEYAWHPVRLMGRALAWFERRLRAAGADGYGGGIALFVLLAFLSVGLASAVVAAGARVDARLGWALQAALVYSLLALGDLLRHVWRIEAAVRRGSLGDARAAVGRLVGRDTDRLDAAACRRAGVESLSESLADGFVSPVFWYVIAGVPGIVLFKAVSTMDSMVGYKTPRYLHFGWCGARLDDVMNYVPARLTWLLTAMVAAFVSGCSPRKAWTVGLAQHAVLPGPNSGWSEAAAAGAIQRRLVGPIWREGAMVTEIWIGDASDPPLETASDMNRALWLVGATGACAAVLASLIVHAVW